MIFFSLFFLLSLLFAANNAFQISRNVNRHYFCQLGDASRRPLCATIQRISFSHHQFSATKLHSNNVRENSKNDQNNNLPTTPIPSSTSAPPTTTPTTVTPLAFTDTVFDEIATQVQSHFADIPFAPTPLVTYCLKHVLERMSRDLSHPTLTQINTVLMAEETPTEYDDFSPTEVQDLADQVTDELLQLSRDNSSSTMTNTKSNSTSTTSTKTTAAKVFDLPLLTPQQEYIILQQIIRTIFQVLTTSEEERRAAWISSQQQNAVAMSQDLLSCPERRRQLVATLNAKVDFPLLGESQEAAILQAAMDQCASILEQILPPKLLQTLKGESREGLEELKDYLVDAVSQRVHLVGLSHERKASMIRAMMDVLLECYANDLETELWLVLSHEEQQQRLLDKAAQLEWEIKASQARHQREQSNLQAQLLRIQTQLLEMKDPSL